MPISELQELLAGCLCKDRPGLGALLERIQRRRREGKPADRLIARYRQGVAESFEKVRRRRDAIPAFDYPEQLPVSARREEIKRAIAAKLVVVIAGETGSGKTTQLPKICLQLGRGSQGLIGHTQPRRIAARTVASRIAEELKVTLGRQVGYQVRFHEQLTDATLVKLMTDGVLLAEIQSDPSLSRYDTLIIDEAHERSLNIDFLLGYLKRLLPARPDLKVIITSATIDVEKFSRHFDNAPVIEVSGRTYPVEVVHVSQDAEQPSTGGGQPEQIVRVLGDILALPKRGDVLVFLSGEREIRETAKVVRDANFPHVSVLPLYARLSLAEQNKVFQPHRGVRVVLATNVAETSLTVPGIRYVIDPGMARVSRYSYRSKVQRLPIEPVSQASANQRKGRCGRVSEGICYRLYSEEDFNARQEYTDPEIVRTNLAAVILQMLRLQLGDIRDFPFVDKPDNRLINDGFNLLKELNAVNAKGQLTNTGALLSRIPVDPRLAAMLLASAKRGSLREVLIIVAVLSIQDPRDRPADKQQAADEKHFQWRDKDSDFVTLLNIWNHFEEQRQQLTRNQFDNYCRRQFMSPLRMREWRDMHRQLHGYCRQLRLQENAQPAADDDIHRALLAGLLGHIGYRHQAKEYLGARNRRFHLFPASALFKKPPLWVMASELIETTRLFGHTNARIESEWVPPLAEHLVKKQYSEPHYDARSGQVIAYQKQTLYGLVIVEKRRCSYGKINSAVSRELFIRGALVEGRYRGKGKFFDHNRRLVKELEDIESRVRRRDILADDQVLYDFYGEKVPEHIVNLAGFEHWRKKAETTNPEFLYIGRERLIQNTAGLAEAAQFPSRLHWQGVDYPLSYVFRPGADDDGVSLTIPLSILHQVPRHRFEWLVPGLLREKCIAMVKGLPKGTRRRFVPVPDYVDRALSGVEEDDVALTEILAQRLKHISGVEVPEREWRDEQLDPYYRMNFRLVDERGKLVASGRDLEALKTRYRQQFKDVLDTDTGNAFDSEQITDWNFGELPETRVVERAGLRITTYPALVLEGGRVHRRALDSPISAENHTRRALVQLYTKVHSQPAKYLAKQLFKGAQLKLAAAGLPDKKMLVEDAVNASYAQALVRECQLPRSADAFRENLDKGKGNIITNANDLERILVGCLENLVEVRRRIGERRAGFAGAVADLEGQLQRLFAPGFLMATPVQWLNEYPRYIKAAVFRLERLPGQQRKDEEARARLFGAQQALDTLGRDWQDQPQALQAEILQYRFMLEEYRVSVFAQQLGTRLPVSPQRLNKQLAVIQKVAKQLS